MLVDKPRLHPMAAAAIESLRKKGLTPKPEHVVWMQDAALKIKRVSAPRIGDLIDWPIECGGVQFFRLSIMAMEWLSRLPGEMQGNIYIQAFAAAHSHDSETLSGLVNPAKVKITVTGWKSRIMASKKALAAIMSEIMGDSDIAEIDSVIARKEEAQRADDPIDYGAVVLALVKRYPGTTPNYWLVEATEDQCMDALAASAPTEALHGREITLHVAFRSIVATVENELRQGNV